MRFINNWSWFLLSRWISVRGRLVFGWLGLQFGRLGQLEFTLLFLKSGWAGLLRLFFFHRYLSLFSFNTNYCRRFFLLFYSSIRLTRASLLFLLLFSTHLFFDLINFFILFLHLFASICLLFLFIVCLQPGRNSDFLGRLYNCLLFLSLFFKLLFVSLFNFLGSKVNLYSCVFFFWRKVAFLCTVIILIDYCLILLLHFHARFIPIVFSPPWPNRYIFVWIWRFNG